MDMQTAPGRYVIKPLASDDPEYAFYWHAYIGDHRINGGVCTDYTAGAIAAKYAIGQYRRKDLYANYIFDFETGKWERKKGVSAAW